MLPNKKLFLQKQYLVACGKMDLFKKVHFLTGNKISLTKWQFVFKSLFVIKFCYIGSETLQALSTRVVGVPSFFPKGIEALFVKIQQFEGWNGEGWNGCFKFPFIKHNSEILKILENPSKSLVFETSSKLQIAVSSRIMLRFLQEKN